MQKKGVIVRITFSDSETTLLQKQQLYMIQSLSYKKLRIWLQTTVRFSDFHQILKKW